MELVQIQPPFTKVKGAHFKILSTPLLQKFQNRICCWSDCNIYHQGQILHQSTCLMWQQQWHHKCKENEKNTKRILTSHSTQFPLLWSLFTCPSGVSAGHIIPHCELCNCLGFANFPDKMKKAQIKNRKEKRKEKQWSVAANEKRVAQIYV